MSGIYSKFISWFYIDRFIVAQYSCGPIVSPPTLSKDGNLCWDHRSKVKCWRTSESIRNTVSLKIFSSCSQFILVALLCHWLPKTRSFARGESKQPWILEDLNLCQEKRSDLSKYSHFSNYAPLLDVKGGIITEKVFPVFSEIFFWICFGLVMYIWELLRGGIFTIIFFLVNMPPPHFIVNMPQLKQLSTASNNVYHIFLWSEPVHCSALIKMSLPKFTMPDQ